MKWRKFCLIGVGAIALGGCAVALKSQEVDYPYLLPSQSFYEDVSPFSQDGDISLKRVVEVSRFSSIPAVREAIARGEVNLQADRYEIPGDGGFFGLVFEKGSDFPAQMIVMIPDLEKSRKITLGRRKGGWQILAYKEASDPVVFQSLPSERKR